MRGIRVSLCIALACYCSQIVEPAAVAGTLPKGTAAVTSNDLASAQSGASATDGNNANTVRPTIVEREALEVSRQALHVSWLALYLSGFQALIGGAGIIFIWLTLRATRNTVTESARAATAAVDAVTHARSVSKVELSAYVNLDEIVEELRKGSKPPKNRVLGFKFSNIGSTPAYEVGLRFDWVSVVRGEDIPHDFDFKIEDRIPALGIVPFNSRITVSPGKQMNHEVILNDEEEARLKAHKTSGNRVFVYGEIFYKNIFNESILAPFCLGYEPDEAHRDRCPFVFSDRHNSARPPFADFVG